VELGSDWGMSDGPDCPKLSRRFVPTRVRLDFSVQSSETTPGGEKVLRVSSRRKTVPLQVPSVWIPLHNDFGQRVRFPSFLDSFAPHICFEGMDVTYSYECLHLRDCELQ